MSYTYNHPLIPCLHKCKYCGERLSRKMQIVSGCYDLGEWYCDKDCARRQYAKDQQEHEWNRQLDKYIRGET